MKGKVVNLRGIPVDLVRRAKGLAGWHGQTLKQFVIEAIREHVERVQAQTHKQVDEEVARQKGC